VKNIFTKTNITIILIVAGGILLIFSFVFEHGTPKFEYELIAPNQIMSSIYKVYGNPNTGFWLSKLVLKNIGSGPAYNVKIFYKLDGYSDWKESNTYKIILPTSTIIDLYYPLIQSNIMDIKTSSPSSINFKITYQETQGGVTKEITGSKSITILGANNFVFSSIPPEESTGSFNDVFSNYPLLAAWATPGDPVVISFADLGNKLAGGPGATLSDEDALMSLAGMWDVSVHNGIQYKTEPEAFWSGQFSEYIKYPRDVIKDKIGTCIDTALFFSTLALTQGLNAYIVLMPGHAFSIIELPSGQLIPVETTTLNNGYTFSQAIESGVNTYTNAINGPYIIIDLQKYQSIGIIPPELPELPTDILTVWNITSPSTSKSLQAGIDSGQTSSDYISFINYAPMWSVTYPSSWSVQQSTNEVYFSSTGVELFVSWGYGVSKETARLSVESLFSGLGVLSVNNSSSSLISGIPCDLITYNMFYQDNSYLVRARYFEYNGYGFAVFYDFAYDSFYNTNLQICESIVQSFTLGDVH